MGVTVLASVSIALSVVGTFLVSSFWGSTEGWILLAVDLSALTIGLMATLYSTNFFCLISPIYKPTQALIQKTIKASIYSSEDCMDLIIVPEHPRFTQMKALVNSPLASDMTIYVHGSPIKAHRILLHLRAPQLLQALLQIESTNNGRIDFNELSVAFTVLLLELLYSSSALVPKQKAMFLMELEVIAKKYQIKCLSRPLEKCLGPAKPASHDTSIISLNPFGSSSSSSSDQDDFVVMDLSNLQLPEDEWIEEMKAGINNPYLSDAVLVAENHVEFPNVHQVFFVKRSQYFEALFSTSTWKSQWKPGGRLNVSFSEAILMDLIVYCYTGQTPHLDGDNVIELCQEADLVGLTHLSKLCQRFIAGRICEDNVQELSDFAHAIQSDELMAACNRYATQRHVYLKEDRALLNPTT